MTGYQNPPQLPDDNQITVKWEFITPKIAERYLAHNVHNRNFRERVALAYAADMAAGNWIRNGETIKFNEDGDLDDGQHRLHAITVSNVKGVWMLVVRGLPKQKAQETIDTGISRKFSDLLKLRGEPNYTTLAATVRGIAVWEKGERGWGKGGTIPFTTTQLFATLDKYPWIREGLNLINSCGVHAALPASVAGPLWWVFMEIDPDDASDFFDKLISGENLAGDNSIHVLRNLLRSTRENVRGSRNLSYLAAVTVKAWNRYRQGEPCGQLKWRPGGAQPEKFPEPL